MRTTPFAHWKEHGERFDEVIRGAAESILGFPFTPPAAYVQACLTPSLGGLGLRRVSEHADVAFAASFHESKVIARESWLEPLVLLTWEVRRPLLTRSTSTLTSA